MNAALWSHSDTWSSNNFILRDVNEDDPEIVKTLRVNCSVVTQKCNILTTLENRCSDWMKMKRIVGHVQTFVSNCRRKIIKSDASN